MEDEEQAELQRNRLKKVQEKNKRAQARYRQKQKEKMVGFEERCHLLTDELENLKAAFSKMEAEKAHMEMHMKDPSVFMDRPRTDEAGPSSLPHRPIPQQTTGWTGHVVEQSYYESIVRDHVAKACGEAQAKESDLRPFEYASPDVTLSIFASLVDELKVRLKYAEERNTAEAEKPVIEVIQAIRLMGAAYRDRQAKLQNAHDYLAIRSKTYSAYGVPRPELWKAVWDAARLSPPQLKSILDVRATFLHKLDTLLRQRKEIVWELQQATCMSETAAKQDDNYSKAVRLSEQLQESLARENENRDEFQRAVMQHIVSEMQEARMIVTAHPHVIDVPAMCDALQPGAAPLGTCLAPEQQSELSRALNQPDLSRGLNPLPAILQIPAVLENDAHITPDMFMNAMASWGANADKNGPNRLPEGSRPMLPPFLPVPNRTQGSQGFTSTSSGVSFTGGGRGSVFLPMSRPPNSQSKEGL